MAQRSSVERLPEGARKALEGWLVEFLEGRIQLDEVMSRLETLLEFNDGQAKAPSRSAVHRHAQKFAALGERMRRAKTFADAFAKEVGPEVADGKGIQVLIHGFESLAFDMLGQMTEDQVLDPESLMFFARSIQSVASARKTDADRALKIADETRKKAASAATKEAKAAGLSEEKVRQIERAILGVDS